MNKQHSTLFLIVCLVLLIPFISTGKGFFKVTPNIEKAYKKTLELRLGEANTYLDNERKLRPDNRLIQHIENYIDCINVIVEDRIHLFNRLEGNKDIRLSKIKKSNKNSPYYLYLQADIRIQWAMARVRYGEYLTAFSEIRKAYRLLHENQKKYPNFMPNQKSLGIIHTLIGSMSDKYGWSLSLLSLKGSIEQGLAQLKYVVDYSQSHPEFMYGKETKLIYGMMLLYQGNKSEKAWKIIQAKEFKPHQNIVDCYFKAVMARETNRNDVMIQTLKNKPIAKEIRSFPILDYMIGIAKLNRQDKDANLYLNRFIKNYKGRTLVKFTYYQLAMHHYLEGNEAQFLSYYKLVRTKGSSSIDRDKKALRDAVAGKRPNKVLLKANYLFEGGYYNKADDWLNRYSVSNFTSKKNKTYYYYLLGRIHQGKKSNDKAVQYFKKAIDSGYHDPAYYACNAALQIGLIYEDNKMGASAKRYFKLCRKIKPEEYKSSLHSKAKAGLERLENSPT